MPYYTDDGEELNPNLYPMPHLCMSCKKKDMPHYEIVCTLTRFDQSADGELICHDYESIAD